MTLWLKGDADPATLPYSDTSSNGDTWCDLDNNAEGREACGWSPAPDAPAIDPAAQALTWSDGAWVVTPIEQPDPVAQLAAARAVATAKVDVEAEAARAGFLTPGTGQAMTYTYKADEAKAWSADTSAPTPFLSAEALARGMTIADLVAEVLASIAAWTMIGARIEAARMGAKVAIATAADIDGVEAAMAIDWRKVIGG